ncbi:MAG: DUF2975 domain-containing protein [Turicibacter sp.]
MKDKFNEWLIPSIDSILDLMIFFIGLQIISFLIIGSVELSRSQIEVMTLLSTKGPLLLIYSLLIYPLYQLRKIIINIGEKEIFIEENITRVNRISKPLFFMAILSCFGNASILEIEFLRLGFFAIKLETCLLIVLGFIALLMSYIFRQAKDYKHESELLKEENELTI